MRREMIVKSLGVPRKVREIRNQLHRVHYGYTRDLRCSNQGLEVQSKMNRNMCRHILYCGIFMQPSGKQCFYHFWMLKCMHNDKVLEGQLLLKYMPIKWCDIWNLFQNKLIRDWKRILMNQNSSLVVTEAVGWIAVGFYYTSLYSFVYI